MYLSDPMARYFRVVRSAQDGREDCGRRSAHQRAGITPAEHARQLRMLRFDHSINGHCWNPR